MLLKAIIIALTLESAFCAVTILKYAVRYDFVVVGAGSAGAVVANRLAADGTHKVLLLEKGPEEEDAIASVPAMAAAMYSTENADHFPVEKQPNVGLGLQDQKMLWVKGQGLGGTSLMNYMVYTHGDREYYDRMAKAGNPGWGYEDVLPYLKGIETAKVPNVNLTYRGQSGEVTVTELGERSRIAHAFVEGCKEYGLDFLQDYNAQSLHGVAYVQANIREGKRCHSGEAFLRDIKNKKNFKIETGAQVTKLIINEETKKVVRVQYKQEGQTWEVDVNKEVILSAGAYATPQILMLSGIGPKDHLVEMGIELIKDLPVGKVLYDHVIYPGLVFKVNDSGATPDFHNMVDPHVWERYIESGDGPLAVPGLTLEAIAFVKTNISTEPGKFPDVELIFTSGSFNSDHGLYIRKEWRISDKSFDVLFEPFAGKPVWSVWPMLFHPLSKGAVKLASLDPLARPKLYGNYFTDPDDIDMKTMIAGIRVAQKIASTSALARFQSELHLAALDGCKEHVVDSDAFWECQIRQIANGVWHPTTTCKMGPAEDEEAVVDNRLRVHGIGNLRVADCSVFPSSFTGHPNGPAMMVGSKAAAMILEDNAL